MAPARPLVLVANAHMHWDPEYSDVKLIQTVMFLSELKSIAERAAGESDASAIPIVLCADLNSLPDSGRSAVGDLFTFTPLVKDVFRLQE